MNKTAYYLKNETDGEFYPKTHVEAIIDDSGNTVNLATEEYVNNKIVNMATKSSVIQYTVTSTSWEGGTAPYTTTITIEGVTSANNIEITPDTTITLEQIKALTAAYVVNGEQAENTIILKALGTKPEVDIPLQIIVRGD